MIQWNRQFLTKAAMAACVIALPMEGAVAQNAVDARVERLEKEMRAVQRKVFSGGDSRFFEPEISAGQTASAPPSVQAGSPGLTPDLLARIDSLESALQRLTGRIEEQELALGDMRARLDRIDGSAAAPSRLPTPVASTTREVATPAPAAAKPNPDRVSAVAAIERPSTGNAGEDAYSYGFRLWDAGFYPEARIALENYIKTYPGHARQSHARNLLGRAWLDDGKPASSVEVFLGNYQDDPKGARAPDSLLYLGQAMVQLDKTDKACVVLDELADVYPDAATGRLASDVGRVRTLAKCN